MLIRHLNFSKPLSTFLQYQKYQFRLLTTTESNHSHLTNSSTTSLVNPAHLLRVCTVLYQQQHSPESRLHSSLSSCNFNLTHEFFLQVCNNFPLSWRPVYLFFQYTQKTHPHFTHNSITFNKMVDIIGKSRNIDLFWEFLQEMGRRRLVNDKTFKIALKTLAEVRELKKCVNFFHMMNDCGCEYSLERLNKVVETLCSCKLVVESKYLVLKLNEWIKPNEITYGWLIKGFCDVGDLIEASKVWNLMVDEGFVPGVDVIDKMIETFFKVNKYDEAMKVFQMMRVKRMNELGLSTYRLVINWMCKRGKTVQGYAMFEEMLKRGIEPDNLTLSHVIYGLSARGRVREAYKVLEAVEKPDISVYHGLIKGLLRLRRASEATQVFREMIKRGCEPTMHTYIMLFQGHMGKRGRKGVDPLVNFDTIFVGGLVKAGKSLETTKYVERVMNRGVEVPRFDYNKFLHYYSNEEGVTMFEEIEKKLREVGLVDLADILKRYGEKMATRERRRNRAAEPQKSP
ncbi:putative pentatricopeptide repeat-containing protein At1g26500 [Mangifera indica]|uniref:putative pentatricopeptide repeat-containing protein At1g26500 n=1 Tax=Mangifera indica TaxID=29780 RepID=UPI001CFBD727|nr:putative pentatricopeptide repeat-containing protein At1g26500 [Mangifera indica]XP_044471757.1 putative pentatricopeptide repeat-containing protein At1g26500 [Mangifera indica]XP_044471766.1 putative pentatricopeptide repeat-containing protein At1g26500 [Mangifera indica]